MSAATGEQLALIRRGWMAVASTVAPDLPEVTGFLESRLNQLHAGNILVEPELLGVVELAGEMVMAGSTPELARETTRRLRRVVYEFLLALDAGSLEEDGSNVPTETGPPAPLEGHRPSPADPEADSWYGSDDQGRSSSWLQRRAGAPQIPGPQGGQDSEGSGEPAASDGGELDPRLVAPKVGFHLTDPDQLSPPGHPDRAAIVGLGDAVDSRHSATIRADDDAAGSSTRSIMIGTEEVEARNDEPAPLPHAVHAQAPAGESRVDDPAPVTDDADEIAWSRALEEPKAPEAAPQPDFDVADVAVPEPEFSVDLSSPAVHVPQFGGESRFATHVPPATPGPAAPAPVPPGPPIPALAPASADTLPATETQAVWRIRTTGHAGTAPRPDARPASGEWDQAVHAGADSPDGDLAEQRHAIDGLLKRKKFDQAGAILQQLAQEIGGRGVAELALDVGDHCRASGKRMAATSCYLAASRADPVFEEPLSRLADICIDDKDTDLAVSYLERIARLTRLRGDAKGALRIYRKIQVVAPYRDDILELLIRAQTTGRLD